MNAAAIIGRPQDEVTAIRSCWHEVGEEESSLNNMHVRIGRRVAYTCTKGAIKSSRVLLSQTTPNEDEDTEGRREGSSNSPHSFRMHVYCSSGNRDVLLGKKAGEILPPTLSLLDTHTCGPPNNISDIRPAAAEGLIDSGRCRMLRKEAVAFGSGGDVLPQLTSEHDKINQVTRSDPTMQPPQV